MAKPKTGVNDFPMFRKSKPDGIFIYGNTVYYSNNDQVVCAWVRAISEDGDLVLDSGDRVKESDVSMSMLESINQIFSRQTAEICELRERLEKA